MNIFQRTLSFVSKRFQNTQGVFTSWYSSWQSYYNKLKFIQLYSGLVYACVNAIAEDVGNYKPYIEVKVKGSNEAKKIYDHPFLRLLDNPNPLMQISKYDLFEATSAYQDLTGEAFWYFEIGEVSKKPKSIITIRPDRVAIAIDKETGAISGYVCTLDDGTKVPLDTYEVGFHKRFDPMYPTYRGVGTVQAGLLYISTENVTSEFQYNFINNQASPSGVLSFNKEIATETFDKLKKEWKEKYGGTKNAGKVLFLKKADATFTKVGLSLEDLNLRDLSNLNDEKVRKMFRVPDMILGITEHSGVGGLGRTNMEAVEYIFAKRTIEPRLRKLDDTLTVLLKRFYSDTDWIKDARITHESQVPEDREAKMKELNEQTNKSITVNEARSILGKKEYPGGDKLYIGTNQIPIDAIASSKTISVKAVKKEMTRDQFFAKEDDIELLNAGRYDRNLAKLLEKQENLVLDKVRVLKGKNKKKQEVSSYGLEFDISFSDEEVRNSFLAVLIKAIIESGEVSLEYVKRPDIEFLLEQAQRDAIFDSTKRQLQSFNEETALKIQKQLAAGLANGESVEELTARIESIYEEAKGYRAKRIAQTEAHNAVNEGAAMAFKQAGYTELVWRNQPPSCKFCITMEGTVTKIGSPFINKGDRVIAEDGKEYVANYQDVKYANLHPECDCKLEPR